MTRTLTHAQYDQLLDEYLDGEFWLIVAGSYTVNSPESDRLRGLSYLLHLNDDPDIPNDDPTPLASRARHSPEWGAWCDDPTNPGCACDACKAADNGGTF